MAEKPILFNTWSVQRILAGEKTAMLRAMKPPPVLLPGGTFLPTHPGSPYQPGDILWIREAWRTEGQHWHVRPKRLPETARIWYAADDELGPWVDVGSGPGRVRPGIFLPKRFTRPNRYEVLTVEVRRPQELTRAEIIAEGIVPLCPSLEWAAKWMEIYGRKSWEANPWCWRYTFREAR